MNMVYNICLFIILLCAFYLRMVGISYPSGLCYDELYSWNIASAGSAFEVVKNLVITDYHPPLYFLSLHYWIKIVGDSDCAMRFLSVIFSLLAVICAYYIGKNYKSRFFGLICAGYFSFVFLFIRQSQTVRFYQAALFFMLLCVLFSIKLIKKVSKKNLILLALSNLALLYTQTTGVIFVFVEILVLSSILLFHKRKCFKAFFTTCLIAFIFYIPQLIIFATQVYNSHHTFWKNPWEWVVLAKIETCFTFNLLSMIPVLDYDILSSIAKSVLILICVAFALYKSYKNNDKCLLCVTLFSLCFSVLFLALNKAHLITLHCNYDYFILANALFLLMFLMSFAAKRYLFLIILLCINIYFTIFLTYTTDNIKKEGSNRFRPPIEYISSNYRTKVLIYSPYGDRLIKKYNNKLYTLGIDGDRLFTMKNWQKDASKVYDVDFNNYSIEARKEYFKKYIIDKNPSAALSKTYNDGINSLKSGDYFIVLCAKSRYLKQSLLNFIVSDKYIYHINSKSVLAVAKITNDILKLAKNDSRLKYQNDEFLSKDWLIIVFKKI